MLYFFPLVFEARVNIAASKAKRINILLWKAQLLLLGLLGVKASEAHSPLTVAQDEVLPTALGLLVVLLFWLVYLLGARRVRPGWRRWLSFNGAMLITLYAAFGPLDEWAERSAAAHMTQHMLMMVVIAPLWVLSQPLPQYMVLLPKAAVASWSHWLRLAAHPMAAAVVHGAVIWFWHAPRFYVLALENVWWHVFEHACFLLTAGAFWWAVLRSSSRKTGHALLALLFTLMHTGVLGALLTFAQTPLYGLERGLESQQLAGLIMWVLGGVPYLGAAAWVTSRWFQQLMRRSASAEQLEQVD